MGKSKTFPVPEAEGNGSRQRQNRGGQQEPLSGSKKVKQKNHVRHNNPEG